MEEQTYQQEPPAGEQDMPQQQPPQQQPPQQQPYQQQPYQPQHMAPQEPGKPALQKIAEEWLPMIVIIGLIIIMIGAILINAANYSDEADTRRDVTITGRIIRDIGVFLLSMITLVAAATRDDLEKWMRIALAGFALVLIVVGYFNIGLEFGMGAMAGGPF